MFKKKGDIKKDMQADNMYLKAELEDTDWKASKNIDIILKTIIETANQNQLSAALLKGMTDNGLDVEETKEMLERRASLRSRIVGDKDIETRKKDFAIKKERLAELTIDVDYYKRKLSETSKRPFPEIDFKNKVDEITALEDWLYENKWVANHDM